jgi:hypothetical protein
MDPRDDDNNHANQLNDNHDAYCQSRGEDERPAGWQERGGHDNDDD